MISELSELTNLLAIDSPAGDEDRMTDILVEIVLRAAPQAQIINLGSSMIARRGDAPKIALLAHIDTTGFTLGYDNALLPIGSPAPEAGDKVKRLGSDFSGSEIDIAADAWTLKGGAPEPPGSRYVYASKPEVDGSLVTAPYLDNRAGVWAALEALRRCPTVAIAFTAGEEVSGHGARVCGRYLFEEMGIRSALIADITWDTEQVRCGAGPAISVRDRTVPNRRFVDRIVALAAASGIMHQLEIESEGGSDGAHIERGSYPIDWTFVGAPEQAPHSSHERVDTADLAGMANLLEYLVNRLSAS